MFGIEKGVILKVLSWNVRRANKNREDVWEHFLEIAPDIALLQEVGSLPSYITSKYSLLQRKANTRNGNFQIFYTSVLVKGMINRPIELKSSWDWVNDKLQNFAGNIISADISLKSGNNYCVASVYSPAWPVLSRDQLTELDVSGVKLENNPQVWLTEILWAFLLNQDMNESSWIVAGDLNSSLTFDYMWKGGPRGNQEIQDRMSELGLIECLRFFQGKLTPTFENPRDKKIVHQIDHLFVSEHMIEHLISCKTGDKDRVFGGSLSDHLPIIADFR
jgi:endonuclease/exonuclease/phosphatase family metal-dependent hydrolase